MNRQIKINHRAEAFLLSYPQHQNLKKEIVKYLETCVDVQNKLTNVKATMTDWNINSPEISNLKNYIIDFLNQKYPFIKERNQAFMFKFFWGNIYRENEFAVEHDHLFSTFSIVYFLKSNPNCAPLVFHNSFSKIKPIEGTFIIFPSYLKHKVSKHKSKNDVRITLSGNIECVEL